MIQMTQGNKKNGEWSETLAKTTIGATQNAFHVIQEIYLGFKTRTLPVPIFSAWSVLTTAFIFTHLDYRLFEKAHITRLYPFKPVLYWSYAIFWTVLFPYFAWGLMRVFRLKNLLKALAELFQCAGLKTLTGRLPAFVADKPHAK